MISCDFSVVITKGVTVENPANNIIKDDFEIFVDYIKASTAFPDLPRSHLPNNFNYLDHNVELRRKRGNVSTQP